MVLLKETVTMAFVPESDQVRETEAEIQSDRQSDRQRDRHADRLTETFMVKGTYP